MMRAMEPPDPERERMRLLERYSGMSDEQLEELAGDWESLTDSARLALRQEMERRGMPIDVQEEMQADDSASPDVELVTVREITFPGEAIVVRGLLESAGIETFVLDVLNNPLESMAPGPVWPIRVQVRKEDVEAAMELLDATFTVEQDS